MEREHLLDGEAAVLKSMTFHNSRMNNRGSQIPSNLSSPRVIEDDESNVKELTFETKKSRCNSDVEIDKGFEEL